MAKITAVMVLITVMYVTVTSIVALPLTHEDDVTWSTPCRRDVTDTDLRPLQCTDAAGSDVTPASDVTSGGVCATKRPAWTYYPFPYDPWLGWYIAAIIAGLMLTLLFCCGMDRAKHAVIDYLDARL